MPTRIEEDRLAALRRYDVLDTPPDGMFDRVTALLVRMFRVPIALVSLVDEDRIWFKSRQGLDVSEIGRSPGLCSSAIQSDEVYAVTNAATDPRCLANPLVAGEFGLRFYAAAPLVTHDGFRLGTVCVIDRQPRTLSAEEADHLRDLAALVIDQMELRLSSRKVIESLTFRRVDATRFVKLDELVTVCSWTKKIRSGDEWLSLEEFLRRQLGVDVTHGISPEALAAALAEWDQSAAPDDK